MAALRRRQNRDTARHHRIVIPKRIHRDLPGDAAWIIGERGRQLTVYLANDVPKDSPLEQHFVRQATRAWRRRHYPGPLVILPIAAGGITWALRSLRRPTVAAGTAAVAGAGIALAAVTVTGPDGHPSPPAVMGAPPTHSPTAPPRTKAPVPSQPPTASPPAASPSPPVVTPAPRPRKAHPTTGRGNSSGKPGRTPPGRGRTPPGHGGPTPGKPPSGPPPDTPPGDGGSTIESTCRLVEIHVGHLVRICL
jgi:hypothetical protein